MKTHTNAATIVTIFLDHTLVDVTLVSTSVTIRKLAKVKINTLQGVSKGELRVF